MEASFDLVDDDWIPVVDGGQVRLVSLRFALIKAHELDGLGLDNPLETLAVLRQVLLPVYLHACGLPTDSQEWGRRWKSGHLDPDLVNTYLNNRVDRFNLFGERPFAQVRGLRTAKNETKPVSLLIAAAATGNNVPVFAARTEADPPALTCAEAARAMLAAHCWDTAAIKSGAVDDPQVKGGKTTGNPTGPLGQLGVIVPMGGTLFETLLLNAPIMRQPQADDRPQWAAEPDTHRPGDPWPGSPVWAKRPVKGVLDLLTWQSRRIRLIPDVGDDGTISVRRVVLAAGDRIDLLPEYEPHTAWRQAEKQKAGQASNRPVRHVPGRAAWRGMEPMLATRQDAPESTFTSSDLLRQLGGLRVGRVVPQNLPIQILTVGVQYGNQSAVVEDVITDRIPLPLAALDPQGGVSQLLLEVVSQAEALRNAANRLGDDLRQSVGGDKLPWDKGQRIGDTLIHQFSPLVWHMLAGLQSDPGRVEEADEAWRFHASRLALDAAESVLAVAPPAAFLGRAKDKRDQTSGAGKARDPLCASVAEAWFRASVRKILGLESLSPR